MITFLSSPKFNQNAAVLLLTKEQFKKKSFLVDHPAVLKEIQKLSESAHFSADAGQVYPLLCGKTLILLVGLGPESDLRGTQLRIYLRTALLSKICSNLQGFEIIPHRKLDSDIKAIIEAIILGTYSWNKYKSDTKRITKKYFICASSKGIYNDMIATAEGVNYARDLVNENADISNSTFLEKSIRGIIKDCKQASIEILNRKELEENGLGLHLAVNKGSSKEPKLIIVKYTGNPAKKGYTALIGKGLTFDTGGLNLKPTGNIENMKLDMGGAAAVIGVLKNTVALNVKKNIIFAVAIAENVTGSNSYKPGDVITGYAKKSVEIANTDAEGRLVLADAIAYVIKNYKPNRVIDIATLTGACIIALGHDFSALVSNDNELAEKLSGSAEITDDWIWRLPNYPELANSIKSQTADLRNTGFPKGAGGTITAAEFLRQFTEGISWAHLDIAGSSFVDANERFYFGYGATGSSVRLLTHFIKNNY